MHSYRKNPRPKGALWLAAGLVALFAATGGLLGVAGEARADSAASASLTWKVSQQAWTATNLSQSHATTLPAFKNPDTGFVFPEGEGSYDPATGATNIAFTGALQLGNTSQGGYRISLANPSIVIDGLGAGSLIADVSYCTGAGGVAPCAGTWPLALDVVVVNFQTSPGGITDTGSEVSWTFTPDYPLQNDPVNPARRQFPQSFLDALAASLQGHFRDSGAAADPNKPPAQITLSFSYASGGEASQTILTEVLASGALTISVAGDEVTLPTPVLNTAGDALVSTGSINEVTVIDLRTSNPGWNVSGQVSDFVSGSDSFGGDRLGWTPEVVSSGSGQIVTPGASVEPGIGLANPASLGTAGAGEGRGTAVLGAGLELELPTDTAPGVYSATLTLTVI